MTFLDLCAGIGGFSLGLEWAGMTCKGQVEIDDYCTRVLQKHWPHVQKWGDLKEIDPDTLPTVDLIAGGPPCQPSSNAGKRKGPEDTRWLWGEFIEIIAEKLPTWLLLENPTGFNSVGLKQVLSVLESKGFFAGCPIIPSCSVGASHKRDRTWIIAYRTSQGLPLRHEQGKFGATPARVEPWRKFERIHAAALWGEREIEPGMVRTLDGVPHRVDRIRGLGNAADPRVVCRIGRAIMAAHYGTEL